MQVICTKCQAITDLTELRVGVGHVFDCEGCNEPLRALLLGGEIVGVPAHEIVRPTMPTIPDSGPGTRS